MLDAPPTGRIARFLNVNAEVAGLAKVGPIRSQADAVMSVLRSPQTAVHLVTLLEEMPVQETADGIAELRAAGLPVGGVVVNLVRRPLLDAARDLTAAARARLDRDAEVAAGPRGGRASTARRRRSSTALLAEAAEHAERRRARGARAAHALGALGAPTYELPLLAGRRRPRRPLRARPSAAQQGIA